MSVSSFGNIPRIPNLRPTFNIGAGLDIISGTYHIGGYGESVLNGGLSIISSVAGPGNAFKSTIVEYIILTVAERISNFNVSVYDTEISLTYDRLNQLAKRHTKLSKIVHGDESLPPEQERFRITSSAEVLGDEYFDLILKLAEDKRKAKMPLVTTPFMTAKGDVIKVLPPTGVLIDSLSEFKITAVEENIVDKNKIGESGNNMMFMRQGVAKKQMITQLPITCAQSSMYFALTAHVGDEFVLDGMAPKKHKLTHAKKGSKITGTTKAFEFINTILLEIFDASLLNNKDYNTGVLYPLLDSDKEGGCTDLIKVHLKLTRNKNGPSGASIDLIVSQREGVLSHLSQFHYIKEDNRYGLTGNVQFYALDLVPDVKLSRTTVRGIIDNNLKVQRALEITSELLQIRNFWATLPDDLMCTPVELYIDLINQGYDWDILLNTRGWWCYREQDVENLPFLSTMDLLRLRKGKYYPYWLNEDKKTFKKEFKHLLNN